MTLFSVFLSKGNSQEISLEMLELENKQCHLYTNFSEEHLRWVGTKACTLQGGPLFKAHCFSHSVLPIGCTMGNFKVEVIYYVGPALGAESVFFEGEQTQSGLKTHVLSPDTRDLIYQVREEPEPFHLSTSVFLQWRFANYHWVSPLRILTNQCSVWRKSAAETLSQHEQI